MEKFKLSMYDNCGEIENFSTCGEISIQLMGFIAIYAVLLLNLLLTLFCREVFATSYALSCGEKLNPKSTFVEKNDK